MSFRSGELCSMNLNRTTECSTFVLNAFSQAKCGYNKSSTASKCTVNWTICMIKNRWGWNRTLNIGHCRKRRNMMRSQWTWDYPSLVDPPFWDGLNSNIWSIRSNIGDNYNETFPMKRWLSIRFDTFQAPMSAWRATKAGSTGLWALWTCSGCFKEPVVVAALTGGRCCRRHKHWCMQFGVSEHVQKGFIIDGAISFYQLRGTLALGSPLLTVCGWVRCCEGVRV